MNKLVVLFCLLAIGLFIGDALALNAPAMQGGNPDKWYIEVEYNPPTNGPASASHGDILEWDLEADTNSEVLGYTVHKVDGDSAEHIAGAVPAWDDTAHNLDNRGPVYDGDVFDMQIYGYHSGVACDGNIAEGAGLAGDANTWGVNDDADGFGFAMDEHQTRSTTDLECNTSTCVKVFIRTGETQ